MTPFFLRRQLLAGAAVAAAASWLAAARADAPDGRFTASGAIVRDAKTGLVWQQTAEKWGKRTDATAACASLDLGGTGWRVPTMKELTTLVDDSRFKPAIDPIFSYAPSAGTKTWSSSPLSGLESAYGWYVEFGDGSTSYQYLTESAAVRCVR